VEQLSRRLNSAVLLFLSKQDIRALTHPSWQALGGFTLPENDALPIAVKIPPQL